MITLHLGIGDLDVEKMTFARPIELTDYIEDIATYNFNCVWLVSGGGEYAEIMITERIDKILLAIAHDHWDDINCKKDSVLHMHEYPTYEDAYKAATDMREGNPLCYGE